MKYEREIKLPKFCTIPLKTISDDSLRVICLFGGIKLLLNLQATNSSLRKSLLDDCVWEDFSKMKYYLQKAKMHDFEFVKNPKMTWKKWFILMTTPIRVVFRDSNENMLFNVNLNKYEALFSHKFRESSMEVCLEMENLIRISKMKKKQLLGIKDPISRLNVNDLNQENVENEEEVVEKETFEDDKESNLNECGKNQVITSLDTIIETEKAIRFDEGQITINLNLHPMFKSLTGKQPEVFKATENYINYHWNNRAEEIEKPLKGKIDGYICDWDKNFLEIKQSTLIELIIISNQLNIEDLMNLTCAKVASMLKGKSPEQMREIFGIENDFTKEEEERIREENKWCEES